MLRKLLLTLSFVSIGAMACAGGDGIKLNDSKTLFAFGLKDEVKNIYYYHEKDLEGRDYFSYNVTDSSGQRTNVVELEALGGAEIKITVADLKNNTEKSYTGSKYLSRGCNELKLIAE